jgi:branched-chain amino acid transport system permease protein
MGVEMVMTNLATLFYTATPRDFALLEKRIYLTKDISIGSIQLICFVLSLVLLFAFQYFLKKTWTGKSIRAVVENSEVATTMGIKSERIMDLAFSLSYMLIGVAAMLLALLNQIDPDFGTPFQSKAFMVCVLAGIGNLGGTFFSGILVGVVTALIGFVVGGEYLNPITYALFVLVLLLRPHGLFTKSSSVARKL